jgi:NAD(P)-dependent dehydrogenase (short-subunit alcohol dehydrogenase family)
MPAQRMLITGVNRGIGLALFKEAEKRGYEVYGTARKEVESLPSSQLFIPIDIADKQDRLRLVEALQQQIPALDILINNAGVMGGSGQFGSPQSWLTEDLEADLVQVFQINVAAPFALIQTLYPLLKKSTNPAVVNISSIMGSIGTDTGPGYHAYRTSKAALNMLSETLKREWNQGRIYCLHPGWVRTELGGAAATLSTEESAQGIMNQIDRLDSIPSGAFLDYEGKEIVW